MFGTSSSVLCTEVYYTLSWRVHYRRFCCNIGNHSMTAISEKSPFIYVCITLWRPMYVRQLARKRLKIETSSSVDTSSSQGSSSPSVALTAPSVKVSPSTTSPAARRKALAKTDIKGPVLTHTPVTSSLRASKGTCAQIYSHVIITVF